MKALLITKCGCSKILDIVEFTNNIKVFLDKEQTIKRTFQYFDKRLVSGIELYLYTEV